MPKPESAANGNATTNGEGAGWNPGGVIANVVGDLVGGEEGAAAAEPSAEAAETGAAATVRSVETAGAAAPATGKAAGTARATTRQTPLPEAATGVVDIPDNIIPGESAEATGEAAVSDQHDDNDSQDDIGNTPKARHAWAALKSEKKTLSAENKKLTDEINELRAKLESAGKPPEMQKLLELQRQVEEYETRIGQYDLAQTKAFRQRFDSQLELMDTKGIQMLQRGGLSKDDAKVLLQQIYSTSDPGELQQLLSEQPVPIQGALFSLATDREQLATQREEALRQWKETKAGMSAQEQFDEEVNLTQNIEKDTQTAVEQALKGGNFMYATTDGANPEWDEAVQARVMAVKGILRSAPQSDLVKWVVEGLTAAPLRELLKTERQRSKALSAELTKRTGIAPRLRGAPTASEEGTQREVKAKDPAALVSELFA